MKLEISDEVIKQESEHMIRSVVKKTLDIHRTWDGKVKKSSPIHDEMKKSVADALQEALENEDLGERASRHIPALAKAMLDDYRPGAAVKKAFKKKLDAAMTEHIDNLTDVEMRRVVVKKLSLIQ